jgi:serine/threonine-protein kinase RsbT
VIAISCRIEGGDFDTAGIATRKLKEHLARIGVSAAVMRRAMIASYEAEMNVVLHARTGTLWARLDGGTLDLEVADEGPGIPNVELALRDGWSTASAHAREMGFGAGMGLPNIRRNSDLFEIETRVGRGTRVRSTIRLDGAADGMAQLDAPGPASLALVLERCKRCLRCIFACPTAALRVHDRGPSVLDALCIGCTACLGECPAGVYGIPVEARAAEALGAVPPDAVCVVPAAFLSGFPVDRSPSRVREALRLSGFSEVRLLEEWASALRREARARAASGTVPLPLIPPLCPGVVALVESRYPSLIPHLGPWLSPIEAAGEEFPLRPVFVAAACPAQHRAALRSSLTGRLTVLAPAQLADAVRARLPRAGQSAFPPVGAREEPVPGEITVTGARHVLRALAAAEAGVLGDVAILDLSLCDTGCAGSPLLSADPYLVRHRLAAAPALPHPGQEEAGAVPRARAYAQRAGVRLDADMGRAIEKLSRIDAMTHSLPGRDCGACGAPSCAAYAEDVVMGRASGDDCPHTACPRVLREDIV